MKATPFFLLKAIRGNKDFHRGQGFFSRRGVYFWGFSLRKDAGIPQNEDELVIYYIGKDEKSTIRRMMEEVTQLIFGGYGTIIDHNWLINNPFKARIFDKQKNSPTDPDVLYKSEGLHVLYDFFYDPKIKATLDWMRERLIFGWIEDNDQSNYDIKKVERELHFIVRTNILGIQRIKNIKGKLDVTDPVKTPYFNAIDWTDNQILKRWLINVNRNMP